jgi:hypothetical protein
MRALLAAWIVLFTHQGEELVIALPAVMLGAAFFLMRYAAGGKSEDEDSQEHGTPSSISEPSVPEPDPPLVGSTWR